MSNVMLHRQSFYTIMSSRLRQTAHLLRHQSLLLFFCATFLFCSAVFPLKAFSQSPLKRIGYLEAGQFWLYDKTWSAYTKALQNYTDVRVEFPADARFSPGWEEKAIATLPEKAQALMQREDLDLIVGMGTAATKALLEHNNGHTPILGMGMADPVSAGIVASAEDSGADNFTCRLTQGRWQSMFRVFYEVVRFSKLGIMYQNTPDGRIYAALDDARAIASELNFTIIEYDRLSSSETTEECVAGLKTLQKKGMDAFFIGPLNCFDMEAHNITPLLTMLNDWQIPTFARDGSDYVKAGALMGFSVWNFEPVGAFLASQTHKIVTGAKPRTLSMKDRVEPSIALNLTTAKAIHFAFPFDVLVAADELYDSAMQSPPQ